MIIGGLTLVLTNPCNGQPYRLNYKSIYTSPSFVGSLGKGRAQTTYQTYGPHTDQQAHKYVFLGVDDFRAKLRGGIGGFYEHRRTQPSQANTDQLGTNYTSDRIGLSYSPKIKIGQKITLAPGAQISYHRARYANKTTSSTTAVEYTGERLGLEIGVLLNSQRFFFGWAVIGNMGTPTNPSTNLMHEGLGLAIHGGIRLNDFVLPDLNFQPTFAIANLLYPYQITNTPEFIQLNFDYQKRFFLGMSLDEQLEVMPSLGYRNKHFGAYLSSQVLLTVNDPSQIDHPHELTLEYYFHTEKERKSKINYFKPTQRGEGSYVKEIAFLSGANFLNMSSNQRNLLNSLINTPNEQDPGYYSTQGGFSQRVLFDISGVSKLSFLLGLRNEELRLRMFASFWNNDNSALNPQAAFLVEDHRWKHLEIFPAASIALLQEKRTSVHGFIGPLFSINYKATTRYRFDHLVDPTGELTQGLSDRGFDPAQANKETSLPRHHGIGFVIGIISRAQLKDNLWLVTEFSNTRHFQNTLEFPIHDSELSNLKIPHIKLFAGIGFEWKFRQ